MSVCMNSEVCVACGVYLEFVFCNSCAFLWEAEMRREGLAVQCLFSIRLLSLGRQLLSQLLPESPWQHLPLWAGRKTMPNIRKKQNHCLHMSRDCPPLVCLLWSMIANLCKTIPVAKEEGALERNILVRAQYKRQALLGHAFYSYSLPLGHCKILHINTVTPFPHKPQHRQKRTPSAALQLSSQVTAAIFRKVTDNHNK